METVQKLGMEDTTKDEESYTEELRIGMPHNSNIDQVFYSKFYFNYKI